MLSVMAAPDWG